MLYLASHVEGKLWGPTSQNQNKRVSVKVEVRASSWSRNKAPLTVHAPREFCLTIISPGFLQTTLVVGGMKTTGKAHCSDASLTELMWEGFLLMFGPFPICWNAGILRNKHLYFVGRVRRAIWAHLRSVNWLGMVVHT